MNNAELFELMDAAAQMRDELDHRMTVARKSSREANFRAYQLVKEHRQRITSICQTPAGFGDWSAELSTMSVEKGMEVGSYNPRRKR